MVTYNYQKCQGTVYCLQHKITYKKHLVPYNRQALFDKEQYFSLFS